jgi:predicted GNAT superfamily acetyltransferase
MPDDLDVVPLHLLKPLHGQGGIALGAFDGERMVGFVFGYLGRTATGQLVHCSHQMGVDPEYQSAGVGHRLKAAQREVALSQGLALMTWTYDPLQSRNAYLNIHKLGAVCRKYNIDYYGAMTDGINAGLPSDRFQVEWWLEQVGTAAGQTAKSISRSVAGSTVVEALAGRLTAGGLVLPEDPVLDAESKVVTIEIPSDYGVVKASSRELALDWRLKTRAAFQAYFGRGYVVTGFSSWYQDELRRSRYSLERDWRP